MLISEPAISPEHPKRCVARKAKKWRFTMLRKYDFMMMPLSAFSLPRIAAFHFLVQREEDARFVEAPGGPDKVVGWSVAADALDDHFGREQLEEVDEGADVVVALHEGDF